MSHDYIPLLIKAVWPTTTIFLVLWFRKPIRKLLAAISRIDLRSGVVSFGDVPSDTKLESETKTQRSGVVHLQETQVSTKLTDSQRSVQWQNSANIFWLGGDLEWTSQTVLRGAPKDKVLHGLRHAENHSSELGFAESGPGKELRVLHAEVQNSFEDTMTRQWRIDFSEKVHAVVKGFDVLMREHQPKFKPPLP